MNKVLKAFAIPAFMSALSGCEHPQHAHPQHAHPQHEHAGSASDLAHHAPLTVATWNIEHLAFPSNTGCKPRSQQDIEKLRSYANSLDANIVALQEVASKEALKAVFPENNWQIIMSEREDSPIYDCRESNYKSTQQKVAFAVHKSIDIVDITHNNQFNLDMPGLRNGLAITVNTNLGNTEILNVHLKSGCFVDDFSNSDKRACQVLEKQAPILDSWLEQRESANTPFIMLGDFNHRLATGQNKLFEVLSNNTNNQSSTLHLSTKNMIGCHPRYPAPIDHIIIGGSKANYADKTAVVHNFDNMQEEAMLSDHCAVSITL